MMTVGPVYSGLSAKKSLNFLLIQHFGFQRIQQRFQHRWATSEAVDFSSFLMFLVESSIFGDDMYYRQKFSFGCLFSPKIDVMCKTTTLI